MLKTQMLKSSGGEDWYRLLSPEAVPEPGGEEEFTFSLSSENLNLGGRSCTGLLKAAFRPGSLSRMERHLDTGEILTVLQGDCVLCAAPPGELKPEKIRAFLLKEGQAVVLQPGAWHWIPFPLKKVGARILVVFQDRTGEEDLEIRELDRILNIEIQ